MTSTLELSLLEGDALEKGGNPERDVAVLLTDMREYAIRIEHMTPEQIRDFIIDYQQSLQSLVMKGESGAQEFEPSAGDGAQAIFERRLGEDGKAKCKRALSVAVNIAKAVELQQIPFTRIGIFAGKIMNAQFGKIPLRFGKSFAAASRLEALCAFFGTTILMDRDIAWAQDEEQDYIVSIGKVTPKNFKHPIHVYSIYKPGIHKCPPDMDEESLMEFIRLKNEGIEHFIGNVQRGILPAFPIAMEKLDQAATLFKNATGVEDLATQRILHYIRENPYPTDSFIQEGMKIDEKQGSSMGIRLLRLSQELLRAIGYEFYHALVEDTQWEQYFRLHWLKEGDVILRHGEEPKGMYYLARGKIRIEDVDGNELAQLSEGEIFGETTCFFQERRLNTRVVAMTDAVVRVISTADLGKCPALRKLFNAVAGRSLIPVGTPSMPEQGAPTPRVSP